MIVVSAGNAVPSRFRSRKLQSDAPRAQGGLEAGIKEAEALLRRASECLGRAAESVGSSEVVELVRRGQAFLDEADSIQRRLAGLLEERLSQTPGPEFGAGPTLGDRDFPVSKPSL